MKILVITEQRQGKLNPTSIETLVAARQIADVNSGTVTAVVIGKGVAGIADELAAKNVTEVLLLEHDLLEVYTPDAILSRVKTGHRVEQAGPGSFATHLPSSRFCSETRRINR